VDDFDKLVLATARSILAADAACPGSEEPSNLRMALEIITGINLPPDSPFTAGNMVKAGTEGEPDPPKIPSCVEKRRLVKALTEGIQDMIMLQQQQIDAVIHDDPDFSRFDLLLHMSAERKQQAKYAFVEHLEKHGC